VKWTAAAVACALIAGASLRAQNQGTVFRADTRLVEVNALVIDKDGHPLEGLTSADFTVLEDGQPQQIDVFAVEGSVRPPAGSTTTAAAPGEPGVPLPNGEYSNRVVARAGGVTVIVLDRLNTSFEDQKLARDQIVDFLKNIGREDRIALYVLQTGTLQILHEFTRDNASLIAALGRYQARTSRSKQASDAVPVDLPKSGNPAEDAEFEKWLKDTSQQVSAFYIRDRVKLTAAAFETIASHLSGVRGRKNVVWVSSAFPLRIDEPHSATTFTAELDQAAKAINGANIAIYAVDARQLNTGFERAALEPTREATHGRAYDADFPKSTFEQDFRHVDTLQSVADSTGGRAFSVLGNIGKGMRQAVEDARLTYMLGYYPKDANWDGAYHTIKVTVNRPGATIRTRRGYYATRFAAADPSTSQEALLEAIRSPLEATGLGVTARVAKGAAANTVTLVIRPVPEAVSLTRLDGRWTGALDFVIAQSLPNGQTFKTFAVKADIALTDEQHAQMLRDGFSFDRTVALRPDSHRLHVIVRDIPSGATGSLIIPIARLR
jgi:VWFA-related protein